MKNARTLLYFGSFNPIHNGHTAMARYVLDSGVCDEIWFVVSPRNPLKQTSELADDSDRLRMVEMAVAEELKGYGAKVCDIEFGMPRPSYTIDTMNALKDRYPEREFTILVGADITPEFGKWRCSAQLAADYRFYVYPRAGFGGGRLPHNFVTLADAPLCPFSSTDVRNSLAAGGNIGDMVSPGVLNYINKKGLWR